MTYCSSPKSSPC